MFLYRQGEYQEAERLFRETLNMNWKLLRMEHPEISTNLNNLVLVLRDSGKIAEALLLRSYRLIEQQFGEKHRFAT